ncbi:hypothetical protein [Catellatospora sp. NPDC049609]|uniref:hypothetical protein n=1 Tax=Catellatospora sp. NPDC049609 TaxID=3155505 RepID=UPI003420F84C
MTDTLPTRTRGATIPPVAVPLPDMPEPPPTSAKQQLVETLTNGHRCWRVMMDHRDVPIGDVLRVQVINSAIHATGWAWMLDALMRHNPQAAEVEAIALHEMLEDGGEAGAWLWETLVERGVNPDDISVAYPKATLADEVEAARHRLFSHRIGRNNGPLVFVELLTEAMRAREETDPAGMRARLVQVAALAEERILMIDRAARDATGALPDMPQPASPAEPAITWRDYTVEPDGESPGVAVLCRSDEACMDHQPNADGRYLTLGEAVDWALEHIADHARRDTADA